MKAKILKTIAVFVILELPLLAQAQCSVQKTTIFFVNGAKATKRDTIDSAENLKSVLEQQPFYNPECVTVRYAYNRTEGWKTDFWEAKRQKELEQNLTATNFWEMFWELTAPRPWFLELMATSFFSMSSKPDPRDAKILAQIEEHLNTLYRTEPQSNRLILLGHSQGSLFGNEEWLAMTEAEKARTKLIAVGTPAESIADGGPYTLLQEDHLITLNFVGGLPSNVPAPNRADELPCTDDWVCHAFEASYLAPATASQVRILKDVKDSLPQVPNTDLPPPGKAFIQGNVVEIDGTTPVSGGLVLLYVLPYNGEPPIATTTTNQYGFYRFVTNPCTCFVSYGFDGHDATVSAGDVLIVNLRNIPVVN